jgi:hypothetical protein
MNLLLLHLSSVVFASSGHFQTVEPQGGEDSRVEGHHFTSRNILTPLPPISPISPLVVRTEL